MNRRDLFRLLAGAAVLPRVPMLPSPKAHDCLEFAAQRVLDDIVISMNRGEKWNEEASFSRENQQGWKTSDLWREMINHVPRALAEVKI